MGIIYKLTFPSGKSYVGLTVQTIKARLRAHRGGASFGKRGALFSAMRKYGLSSMVVEILAEESNFETLKLREIEMIKSHDTKVPKGYNLTDGGDGVLGVIITEEARRNRRVGMRKSFADPERRKRHLESQRTDEIKLIRSKIMTRIMADPKERKKRSIAMKRKWKTREFLDKMKSRPGKPRILDGLTRCQRYRLKDIEAYRKRKREYAQTPIEREKRRIYMKKWQQRQKQ